MAAQPSIEPSPIELARALPVFPDMEIADWQDLSVRQSRAHGIGQITTAVVTMNNQARYVNREIYPKNQTNDVRVEIKTALGTRVAGFNTLFGEIVAEASGSVVSITGSNQACDSRTTLPEDVWATNLIMIARDKAEGAKPDERMVFSHGKSRGGMGGNGKLAYAPIQGRSIDIGLHEDPCLLHPVGVKETLEGINLGDLALEGLELARSIVTRRAGESHWAHLRRLHGMAATVALGPQYLKAQLHTGRALWKGDSGIFLANMPADQALISLMMNKNDLNHRIEYGEHNERLRNGHIIDRKYKHLAMVRPVVLDAGAAAIAEGTRRLERGESPASVADVLTTQLEFSLPAK